MFSSSKKICLAALVVILSLFGRGASAQFINPATTTLGANVSASYFPDASASALGAHSSYSVFAGAIRTQLKATVGGAVTSTFNTFCVDINTNLNPSSRDLSITHAFTTANFNAAVRENNPGGIANGAVVVTAATTPVPASTSDALIGSRIGWLYDTYANGANVFAPNDASHRVYAAALQLAIWEVEYDYNTNNSPSGTNGNSLDLGVGHFRVGTVVDAVTGLDIKASVVTQANLFLSSVGTNSAVANYYQINETAVNGGAQRQSLLGQVTTPEPGSTALLGAGLLSLIGFIRKRKSRQSA